MNGHLDRGAVEAILAERARVLARPIVELATAPTVDVVEFACGDGRYAIEAAHVHRLEPLGRITPLPGAPRHYSGITNLHGQLMPLVDPAALIGAPACSSPAFVLVIGMATPELGLVADELRDIRSVEHDQFARGVTADGTAIINAAAILADPRLVVAPADGPPKESTL